MLATSEGLPIIHRTVQASVNSWLFKEVKGGNKSLQCHLTALEINTIKQLLSSIWVHQTVGEF